MDDDKFNFILPDNKIALYPRQTHAKTKLLYLRSSKKKLPAFLQDDVFSNIKNYFKAGDVLVVNDTKVIKANLQACKIPAKLVNILLKKHPEILAEISKYPEIKKMDLSRINTKQTNNTCISSSDNGGNSSKTININLLRKITPIFTNMFNNNLRTSLWQCAGKPMKKLTIGDFIFFIKPQLETKKNQENSFQENNFQENTAIAQLDFIAIIVNKQAKQLEIVFINLKSNEQNLTCLEPNEFVPNEFVPNWFVPNWFENDFLEAFGNVPLPPYIVKQRQLNQQDEENYQTIFADKIGAVAAPTAGLHFSQELIEQLKAKQVKIAYVTLHVGAGTFFPLTKEQIAKNKLHEEYCSLTSESACIINEAKQNNGCIVATGTTSLRLLESVAIKINSSILQSFNGYTDLFIKPGFNFKIVDKLITNFHLPNSSLFMLVCAFGGTDAIRKLYQHAIEQDYMFYSYGDTTFIDRL